MPRLLGDENIRGYATSLKTITTQWLRLPRIEQTNFEWDENTKRTFKSFGLLCISLNQNGLTCSSKRKRKGALKGFKYCCTPT